MTVEEIKKLMVGETIIRIELGEIDDGNGVNHRIEIYEIETFNGYVIHLAPYYESPTYAPTIIDTIVDKNEKNVHGPTIVNK